MLVEPIRKTQSLESVALQGGMSIAKSVLARVEEFPKRESILKKWMTRELESVPTQILWQGLEDEAAPVFVVYKLLHEAFSNSPMFFRRFITELMTAQPERFASVFSRETLWSVVARSPGIDVPEDCASPESIQCLLESLNKKSFWRRSEEELERDARTISSTLNKMGKADFRRGVAALRRLQLERATGLTQGNLMLFVPAKLNQFVTEVAELGMHGNIPPLKELCGKIHEMVRDPLGEGRHQSIPMDVLFTDPDGDSIECFLLVRRKATITEQVSLRKKLLLVRYFLKFAFNAYEVEKLHVRLAFYLDPDGTFKAPPHPASLFHTNEVFDFQAFWRNVTGRPNGEELVFRARDAAATTLTANNLMRQIKAHFSRDRKPGCEDVSKNDLG